MRKRCRICLSESGSLQLIWFPDLSIFLHISSFIFPHGWIKFQCVYVAAFFCWWHLDWFHFPADVNRASININMKLCLWRALRSSGSTSRCEQLSPMVVLFLIFWDFYTDFHSSCTSSQYKDSSVSISSPGCYLFLWW